MQILNYFLASIVSYSGLLLGIFLIKIAPEEQKQGKRYFSFLRNIFVILIIGFLSFYYIKQIFIILLIMIFFIVFLFLNINLKNRPFKKITKTSDLNKSLITYILLAIIFYLSYKNANLFIVESSLIFLYGIVNSSLLLNIKRKNYIGILSKHILFIIIAQALFFY